MKDIKNYLHLYLGCDVQYPNTDGNLMIATLTGVSRADGVETTYKKKRFKKGEAVGDYLSWKPNGHHNSDALHLKLILRPLYDMTEEEKKIVFTIAFGDHEYSCFSFDPVDKNILADKDGRTRCAVSLSSMPVEAVRFLLSDGFDLFELIPEGLAIDKTTLK